MLPNRMQLNLETEDQLKKLKSYTGITPNVAARIAFFKSVESDFRYVETGLKTQGTLVLDKITWLGDTRNVTELLLQFLYPELDSKHLARAWAAHVHDGLSALRNHRSLVDFASAIADGVTGK